MSLYSRSKNGAGIFIPQLKKLTLNYCERSGSSRGLIDYFRQYLFKFARANPHVEIVVTPRPSKHPLLRGKYLSDGERSFCVKNMNVRDIEERMQIIAQASGVPSAKPPKGRVVNSAGSSVTRGLGKIKTAFS